MVNRYRSPLSAQTILNTIFNTPVAARRDALFKACVIAAPESALTR